MNSEEVSVDSQSDKVTDTQSEVNISDKMESEVDDDDDDDDKSESTDSPSSTDSRTEENTMSSDSTSEATPVQPLQETCNPTTPPADDSNTANADSLKGILFM